MADMVKRAAVSLIQRDGLLLCVWNRRYDGWSFPGGLVEDGETVEEAQARELREEAGLETVSREPLYAGAVDGPVDTTRASVAHVFLVVSSGEPRAAEEGCPIAWMTRDDFLASSPFGNFYKRVFAVMDATADLRARLATTRRDLAAQMDLCATLLAQRDKADVALDAARAALRERARELDKERRDLAALRVSYLSVADAIAVGKSAAELVAIVRELRAERERRERVTEDMKSVLEPFAKAASFDELRRDDCPAAGVVSVTYGTLREARGALAAYSATLAPPPAPEPARWQCGNCGTFNEGRDLAAACRQCHERGDGTIEPTAPGGGAGEG